ncbi:MAG TPA: glycosyltransferase, partial [Thermoanaerobaculia bacterium]|nr:glycosyltransferase [Thermoanaerobaculia bacterium]
MKRMIVFVGLGLFAILFLLDRAVRNAPAIPSSGLEVLAYLFISLIVFLDLIDIVVRLTVARRTPRDVSTSIPLDVGTFTPHQMKLHLKPWALIVSVHNLEDDLDPFLEAMEPYRDNLWVIDDASTDRTFLRLQQAGIHCIRGSVNRKKPGALKELLHHLPPDIATIGILDPDVHIRDNSRSELSDLEQSL